MKLRPSSPSLGDLASFLRNDSFKAGIAEQALSQSLAIGRDDLERMLLKIPLAAERALNQSSARGLSDRRLRIASCRIKFILDLLAAVDEANVPAHIAGKDSVLGRHPNFRF